MMIESSTTIARAAQHRLSAPAETPNEGRWSGGGLVPLIGAQRSPRADCRNATSSFASACEVLNGVQRLKREGGQSLPFRCDQRRSLPFVTAAEGPSPRPRTLPIRDGGLPVTVGASRHRAKSCYPEAALSCPTKKFISSTACPSIMA